MGNGNALQRDWSLLKSDPQGQSTRLIVDMNGGLVPRLGEERCYLYGRDNHEIFCPNELGRDTLDRISDEAFDEAFADLEKYFAIDGRSLDVIFDLADYSNFDALGSDVERFYDKRVEYNIDGYVTVVICNSSKKVISHTDIDYLEGLEKRIKKVRDDNDFFGGYKVVKSIDSFFEECGVTEKDFTYFEHYIALNNSGFKTSIFARAQELSNLKNGMGVESGILKYPVYEGEPGCYSFRDFITDKGLIYGTNEKKVKRVDE